MSRRQALRLGATALTGIAGMALLAACGSGAAPAANASTSATSSSAATSAASSAAPASRSATTAAPASAAAQGGTLTLMIQTDAKQQTMYENIVKAYTSANNGAKVNIIQGGASALNIQQKLLLLISANTAPDVFWTHTYINGGLSTLNIPADVSPYMAKDKAFDTSDIFDSSLKDFNVGGKQYAFPRETTAIIMVYNKALFDKAGQAVPTASWSWDDYVAMCQKLTSGSGPTKVFGTAGWPNDPYIYPAVVHAWQLGADMVDANRTKYTLDSDAGIKAFQDIADLIHKYKVHASASDLQGTNINNLFTTGRVAMLPTINVYSGIASAKFDWDIIDMPLPSGGTKTTRVASAGHSMTQQSQMKDLAWSMMTVLASKAAYQAYFDQDQLPVASKSVRQAAVAANGNKPPAHIQIGIDALNYARPEPVIGNWIGIHQAISGALQGVYGPEAKDVKTALTSVADQVNQLITAKPTATQ